MLPEELGALAVHEAEQWWIGGEWMGYLLQGQCGEVLA